MAEYCAWFIRWGQWNVPTADKVALYTSVAALLLSALNVVFTSPVLIDLYAKPRLTAAEDRRQIDGETFRTTFTVANHGFNGARGVEVILSAHPKDTVQVSPGVSATVEEAPYGPPLKTVRVKLKYLASDEEFSITVSGAKKQLLADSQNYYMENRAPVNLPVPAILNLRSEKGLGTFSNQAPWFYAAAAAEK